MDWVLNNLENVIIPIIIMVLYGLGSVGQKKKKGGKQAPGQPQPQADPEEARRVREIQEEIRRKIAERTGRVPPPAPAPARQPEVRQSSPPQQPRFPTPSRQPTPKPPPVPVQAAPTYQDELQEKLKKIKELETHAGAQAPSEDYQISRSWDIPARKAKSQLRSQLFADLSHPMGKKKAILVSEILGAPVGIKGPIHWKSNV